MDSIIVKAPVRVDFAGGPSDVAPFCVEEWGYVVNGAIDKYATVRVWRRADSCIVMRSDDLQLEESYPDRAALRHDTPLRLLTTAVELAELSGGVEIAVRTDVPAGAGLGASAAVSVALLFALRTLGGAIGIDRDALARASIGHETGTLRNTGGGQDQYAAAFGGFQGFHFAGDAVRRNPLPVAEATRRALEESLLLCYSGTSRISGSVLGEIMKRYRDGDAAVIGHLRRLREVAQAVEALLLAGDLAGLGGYLTEAWYAFRALHPSVSTPIIERIFAVALAQGASGGKATGAGGGGCVLLACEPARRETVAAALHAEGFSTIPFRFTQGGVAVVHE
jgi:D-glycero-alpha-D-manno-heptose-7-phosphate kinase